MTDPRPGGKAVIQTADAYVRGDGLAFHHYNGGLDIAEYAACNEHHGLRRLRHSGSRHSLTLKLDMS